jgi:DNA-directed RNA polymerase subunit M/transcription elongation factor TFIIS
MGKTQKVATLLGERQKIEKEIEEIQKSCQHPTKSIKNVRERLDSTSMVTRYVCDECSLIIGIPNNDELQNFLKQ